MVSVPDVTGLLMKFNGQCSYGYKPPMELNGQCY